MSEYIYTNIHITICCVKHSDLVQDITMNNT